MKIRLVLFITLIFLAGCGKGEGKQIAEFDGSKYERVTFESIHIPEGIEAFTLSDSGSVICSSADENLYVFNQSGTKDKEVTSGSFYGNLCVDGDSTYAYDYINSAIVQLEKNGEFLTDIPVIQNTISFHTIRNMVAIDGKIYVLAIPFTSDNMETFFAFGKDEYEDYGEVVYSINIEDSQYRTVDIDHIAAEYKAEDGRRYFYGWKEDKYYLYMYNTSKEEITQKLTFDSMGNFLSIVVEGGYLFGIDPASGLAIIDLETGEKVDAIEGLYAMFGNDLQFYRGNLFVNNIAVKEIQQILSVDVAGDITIIFDPAERVVDGGKSETDIGGSDKDGDTNIQPTTYPKRKETIGVSAAVNLNLRTEEIRHISGMKTKMVEQIFDLEALIAELMAGNPDVDIYVFPHGWALTQRIKELGLYVPLNDSEIITSYLGKCFDYIQSVATNDNGEIWMVPLFESAMGTWYIPENMEKFGISVDELVMLDDYISVLERLNGKMGEFQYYNNGMSVFAGCDSLYDANYNNYESGEIDFNTELYRHIAEFFWTGWDRYGSEQANHPLFFKLQQHGGSMFMGKTPDFNRDLVIFKTINMQEHLIGSMDIGKEESRNLLEGWRVLPFPSLQSMSEKKPIAVTYALVNPYSKQKEAATKYLEVILENQAKIVEMPVFFREDTEYYEPYYDTSIPAFKDIYEIFKEADVFYGHSWDLSDQYITEFQRGLITFDEAISRRQKQAITGLYE